MSRYKVVDIINHGASLELRIEPIPNERVRAEFEMLMIREINTGNFDGGIKELCTMAQRFLDQLSQ